MSFKEDGFHDLGNGKYMCLENGVLHAIGKPAMVNDVGSFWMINGQYHRENGAAVEKVTGTKEWYKNGLRHCEDGAAIEFASGDKHYYQNGKCHRLDGPAIDNADGYKDYWVEGKKLSAKEFMGISKKAKKGSSFK